MVAAPTNEQSRRIKRFLNYMRIKLEKENSVYSEYYIFLIEMIWIKFDVKRKRISFIFLSVNKKRDSF
jgi:hypothetical protein